MGTRPTLEEQVVVSKMTCRECVATLKPKGFFSCISYYMFYHLEFLWRIIH